MISNSMLADRFAAAGPKRLLALDGGGVRGLVTLGYLGAIERLLRERYRRPEYRLADYFDFIGGTSTGAIIATLLSLGWNVADVTLAYIELAEEIFKPNHYWGLGPIGRVIASRYDAEPMEVALRRLLGERALDSPDVLTGLMIITKRVDTASVWPIVNMPSHLYFNDRVVEGGLIAAGNRHFKLWELLRASTAAPTVFRPKRIGEIRGLQSAVFVDGAMSSHNDPALQLLMAATLDGFGLGWPLGAEQLLLCSVGTGMYKRTVPLDSVEHYTNLDWAQLLVPQLIGDSMNLIETILQWLSLSPTARSIDRTIGTVAPKLGGDRGLLHYVRYNIQLDAGALEEIGVDLKTREILAMRSMSNVNALPHLMELAAKVDACVKDAHFPAAFDPEPAQ